MSLTKLYQKSGLQSLVQKSGVLGAIAPSMAALEHYMPQVSDSYFEAKGQTIRAKGERRARVAILSGCVMPLVNGPEMEAAVRVLARNGCEVVVPKGQACCGAINSHVGDLETARKLARRNIDVFTEAGVEYVIVASAGCGSRMKEYGHLLAKDRAYSEKAERFSATVKDINEFLVELPFDPPRAAPRLPRHLPGLLPPRKRATHPPPLPGRYSAPFRASSSSNCPTPASAAARAAPTR